MFFEKSENRILDTFCVPFAPGWTPFRVILGPFWAILGHLGGSWAPLRSTLRASWAHHATFLGHLGVLLESSWSLLGLSWPYWPILEPSRWYFASFWSHLAPILEHFSSIWLHFLIFVTSLWCHWQYLFEIHLVYCFDHLLQISVLLYDMEVCNCSMYTFVSKT